MPPLPIGTLICLTIELTSSATLIATLPSLWIVGWTSNDRPTSMYCTLLVEKAPPTVALVPEVTTGRRSPTRILAFSLLRARIRGLDSTLVAPTVFKRSTLTPSEERAMVLRSAWRCPTGQALPVDVALVPVRCLAGWR